MAVWISRYFSSLFGFLAFKSWLWTSNPINLPKVSLIMSCEEIKTIVNICRFVPHFYSSTSFRRISITSKISALKINIYSFITQKLWYKNSYMCLALQLKYHMVRQWWNIWKSAGNHRNRGGFRWVSESFISRILIFFKKMYYVLLENPETCHGGFPEVSGGFPDNPSLTDHAVCK